MRGVVFAAVTLSLVALAPPLSMAHHYALIQPGMGISSSAGGCTLNFVFYDANTLDLYAGTAGHCVPVKGEGTSRVGWAGGGGSFATTVYNACEESVARPVSQTDQACNLGDSRRVRPLAADFALLRIDADKQDAVSAELRFWGGPSGSATSTPIGTTTLHYGHGVGFGMTEATRPRVGALEYVITSGSLRGYFGAVHPGVPGDSGSPVLTGDGKGLGILTHIRFLSGSTIEGPTMTRIFEDLGTYGWGQIRLSTSLFRPLASEAQVRDDGFDTRVETAVEHCSIPSQFLDPNRGCVTTS